jgi:hypothetical protein
MYKITHPYGTDKFVAEQDPGAAAGVGASASPRTSAWRPASSARR